MKTLTFPDGMPHIILEERVKTLKYSIRNPTDLIRLGMIADVNKELKNVELHYVMGSRMDRAISRDEPNTLRLVCNYLKLLNLDYRVIFPHSSSIIDRLDACRDWFFEIRFLKQSIDKILTVFNATEFDIILPDQGAEKRFYNDHISLLHSYYDANINIVVCSKHRDMSTGKLSGFKVPEDVKENVVILDDLCDGGGTFVGLAEKLRERGAKKIGLVVYHGIMSKGTNLPGLDYIVCSNSFKDFDLSDNFHCIKVI